MSNLNIWYSIKITAAICRYNLKFIYAHKIMIGVIILGILIGSAVSVGFLELGLIIEYFGPLVFIIGNSPIVYVAIIIEFLLFLFTIPAFILSYKLVVSTFVARQVAPHHVIETTPISVIRNAVILLMFYTLSVTSYWISVIHAIGKLIILTNKMPGHPTKWPANALLPPAIILESGSFQDLYVTSKERFTVQWPNSDMKQIGLGWFPIIYIIGFIIYIVLLGLCYPYIGAAYMGAFTVGYVMFGLMYILFGLSLLFTVSIIEGLIYARSRGWDISEDVDDGLIDDLFYKNEN